MLLLTRRLLLSSLQLLQLFGQLLLSMSSFLVSSVKAHPFHLVLIYFLILSIGGKVGNPSTS